MDTSLTPDYINILKDPFQNPTIRGYPIPKTLNPSNLPRLFGIVSSALGLVTGVNFNELYQVSKPGGIDKSRFDREFKKKFHNDPLVHQQIQNIISLEVDNGLLKPANSSIREDELMDWLFQYYKTQLSQISITTSTISNYKTHLKLAYITFSRLLSMIFKDGIWVHTISFQKIHEALTNLDFNVLLLPNHRSHIDYIIIHYLFVRVRLETPIVIAGDNLNVTFFGTMLKKLGALFIKRSFTSDFYYSQSISHLISLKEEENPLVMELFIEGTRSRNGKLTSAKTGFLKLLQNVLKRNTKIVPVALSYEKPAEFDEYLTELNGFDKVQESFSQIVFAGVKYLKSDGVNFGKLVIRFDELLEFEGSMGELSKDVLKRIEDVEYVFEISVLGMSLLIKFYQNNEPMIDLGNVVDIFKTIIERIVIKTIYDDHLLKYLDQDSETLIIFFKLLINKFLSKYISVQGHQIRIHEETALVYYKNILLHFFIPDIFLIKTTNPISLDNLIKIFSYEFQISEIPLIEIDALFQDLLTPFIESYRLVLSRFIGVVEVSLKNWLHLVYASRPSVKYRESLNKSNLLYAVHLLKVLKLIVVENNMIKVVNEDGIKLIYDYLTLLENNEIGSLDTKVWKLLNPTFSSNL